MHSARWRARARGSDPSPTCTAGLGVVALRPLLARGAGSSTRRDELVDLLVELGDLADMDQRGNSAMMLGDEEADIRCPRNQDRVRISIQRLHKLVERARGDEAPVAERDAGAIIATDALQLADELPFLAGPLYRSESTKSWRSDTQRSSAIGLDQPLAVALLSGV